MSKEAANYYEGYIQAALFDNRTKVTIPEIMQSYADECVEKNNEEWRKTLKDIGKLKPCK